MRLFIPAFFFLVIVCTFSCTKIDSTVLGGDLIPAVDNVNTFDTTINVLTTNTIQNDDSTKPAYTDLLAVGHINDPLFGISDASLYFEMKPANFSESSAGTLYKVFRDSLIGGKLDSTVLCLRYSGGYGDTTQRVIFDVFALSSEFTDTIRYSIKEQPPVIGTLLGSSPGILLNSLNSDSVPIIRSTTFNYKTVRELRIPLDPSKFNWLSQILTDSASLSSDNVFTQKIKGFAIKMRTPVLGITGSMAYFNISDTASKLEFFYKRKNGTADTTHTTFYFNSNNSGFADNINWNRTGAPVNAHLNPVQPDPLVYIKTTPGTVTRIRIPSIQNLSNRIVHRAELKMYQVPDTGNLVNEGYLVVPPLLYLERFVPGNIAFNKYLSIPIDLAPNSAYADCFPTATGIDYAYFGGFPKTERVNNTDTKAYTFNISRYVQQIITNHLTNADLRLTSNMYSQYDGCGAGTGLVKVTNNPLSYGRVRLGGGDTTSTNQPYKMRLRIIYSKL